jgi:hypothetical protein
VVAVEAMPIESVRLESVVPNEPGTAADVAATESPGMAAAESAAVTPAGRFTRRSHCEHDGEHRARDDGEPLEFVETCSRCLISSHR